MAFLMGIVVGIVGAAIVAGWVWVRLTPGDDHPLSPDEIRARVGEAWG